MSVKNNEVNRKDEEGKTLSIRAFTFQELANNYNEIEKKIEELGEGASEEYYQMHEMAKNLLAGKLDEVWRLKKAIENHCEAIQLQLSKNQQMIEDIDYFVEQAVIQSPDKTIEGMVTKAKLQRNSRGSVIIHNESDVPEDFKKFNFEFSQKFSLSDKDQYNFFAGIVLGRVISDDEPITVDEQGRLDDYFSVQISKSDIEKKYKNGETVSGTEYKVGHHLKFDAGKVKIKAGKKEALNEAAK